MTMPKTVQLFHLMLPRRTYTRQLTIQQSTVSRTQTYMP